MARFPAGQRLRESRLAAGLTVEAAALAVQRTAYTINSYELGRVEPPVHILVALSALYGVGVEGILREAPALAGSA